MSESADRVRAWIRDANVDAEFLRFESSVHTVEEAVQASGEPVERFTKSIVMITPDEQMLVVVVPADSRASTERVRKALDLAERPRVATAAESQERLGQPVGGNHPFDLEDTTVLIDPRVAARDWILTGGGDDRSLVKIAMAELRRVVAFTEVRVRK